MEESGGKTFDAAGEGIPEYNVRDVLEMAAVGRYIQDESMRVINRKAFTWKNTKVEKLKFSNKKARRVEIRIKYFQNK